MIHCAGCSKQLRVNILAKDGLKRVDTAKWKAYPKGAFHDNFLSFYCPKCASERFNMLSPVSKEFKTYVRKRADRAQKELDEYKAGVKVAIQDSEEAVQFMRFISREEK